MKKLISIILIMSISVLSASAAAMPRAKSPQAAAKGLYQAWQAKSRITAKKYANAEAVDKLFGVKRHTMSLTGCTKNDDGDFECIYKNAKFDLSFAFIVKSVGSSYRVVSITFSSEAI